VTLCQVRVTLAGRVAPGFAMAMNISAANLGITLGALAGGWVVARWGVDAIGWGSLSLMPFAFGLAAVLASRRYRRQDNVG
jgi:MFS transporter, DHA1 family, inner membrane transport protein